MKLIDADALDSALLTEGLASALIGYPCRRKLSVGEIRGILQRTPRIDPIHAAGACYCRECKNSKSQKVVGNGIDEPPYIAGTCCRKFGLFPMKDADFCSYGERQENEGKNE